MDHDRIKVLRRLEAGEITAEQADALLSGRKKPGPKAKPKPPKKANGRPPVIQQRETILAFWVLFHDKMPKQRLKEILSDALNVDISVIDKRKAEISRIAKNPNWLILRNYETGTVMAVRKTEFRRMQMRERRLQSLGLEPLSADEVMAIFDTAKTPSN